MLQRTEVVEGEHGRKLVEHRVVGTIALALVFGIHKLLAQSPAEGSNLLLQAIFSHYGGEMQALFRLPALEQAEYHPATEPDDGRTLAIGVLHAVDVLGGFHALLFNPSCDGPAQTGSVDESTIRVYPIIVGVYLGDCVTTAIVCSIGASPDSRRVGIINIAYNLIKSAYVLIGVAIAHYAGFLDGLWNQVVNSSLIANTNTLFNIVCALLILPVIPLLEKLSYRLVKEEPAEVDRYQEKFEALNPNFFNTPAIALSSCYDLLLTQFQLAKKNIILAYGLLSDYDEKIYNEIQEDEVYIDRFADRISAYLVSLLPHLKDDLHTAILDEYYRVFTEFERLGDHAVNISDNARGLADKNMAFSATAMGDLNVLMKLLEQILDETELAFKKRDINAAYRIQPLRKVAADMVLELKESHLARMGSGACNVFLDPNFENLLSDMIRIADVSSNVGEAVIVRVRPEVASREHTYFADLRHENEDYNRIYQDARKKYFDMLPEDAYGESGSDRKNNALPQFNDA